MSGWAGIGYHGWADVGLVRGRLAAGADPNVGPAGLPGLPGLPLHRAAGHGSPEVVALLAARVDDVDAVEDGRTALWEAVFANRPDNVRALLDAGADAWRPVMAGWSPGRLGLVGPHGELFSALPGAQSLSPAERKAAASARQLRAVLDGFDYDGFSLTCVAGIDAGEAVRRLSATVVGKGVEVDPWEGGDLPWSGDEDSLLVMGATSVAGGCVVAQPWGYGAQMPRVMAELSRGTTCYGMYANPKSGEQGGAARAGKITGWGLDPGGWPEREASPEQVLAKYLYRGNAVAYCCAQANVHPDSMRPFTGPFEMLMRLPTRDDYRTADYA